MAARQNSVKLTTAETQKTVKIHNKQSEKTAPGYKW